MDARKLDTAYLLRVWKRCRQIRLRHSGETYMCERPSIYKRPAQVRVPSACSGLPIAIEILPQLKA
jgi:hypothetical protein